ncbi:hypothetical protein ET445_03335 [Agromyces protaetiae]|uniref:Uncharacterized protein n=1 Tax=Agromyces protaetiae TaxID=2509455 RepID=A0A4P6FFI2_9MICO|nr:hypothetical protein [Agromyces protaetiae]QAY72517.1 hypothetical protein ET445_03335 [Agromyces protaetiae]
MADATPVVYEDVAGRVGEFKRAAIDAYMRTQPYAWSIDGDHYEISSSSTHTKVTRPRADGSGGGDWSSDNFIAEWFTGGAQDEQWGDAFDTIRKRIDGALEGFLDLPDPRELDAHIESCRTVARDLSGSVANTDGKQTGAGRIPGLIGIVERDLGHMAGDMVGKFNEKFVVRLGGVVSGYHGLSIIIGGALSAEQGLWTTARNDVGKIFGTAMTTAKGIAAAGTSPNVPLALDIAGWAVDGLGIFYPGAGPVLEAIGLGLEVVSATVENDDQALIDGTDFESMLGTFEASLAKLSSSIRVEEESLRKNLEANFSNVNADRESYDFAAPPSLVETKHEGATVIAYRPDQVRMISRDHLPAIAEILRSSSAALTDISMSAVFRTHNVGLGPYGPKEAFNDLRWLLYELVKNTAWDVEMGGKDLGYVLDEIEGQEAQIVKDVEQFLAELDGGNPTDPFDAGGYPGNSTRPPRPII